MTTTDVPTLGRLVASYLTRVADPADMLIGAAQNAMKPDELLDLLKAVPRTRATLANDPFDEDKEQGNLALWESRGIHFITREDTLWPSQLGDLETQAPYGLWYKGSSEAFDRMTAPKVVAIVGARAASSYGEHVTHNLVEDLGRTHLIISGGAYGIDGAAHRQALTIGEPTVIVSASGLTRPYPSGNRELFDTATERGGVVISEAYPSMSPSRHRFTSRNRLIAALSQGTVVVEAGFRSGTLNTARWAQQIGRPVGAVPGPVTSATSAGCHWLLSERDATIITSGNDVTRMLEVKR